MCIFKKKQTPEFAVVSEKEAKIIPYPYVYVNDDGTVRELRADERSYLETSFHPVDGARPYVKSSYHQKNGRGNLGGFCRRKKIPSHIVISELPQNAPATVADREVINEQIRLMKEKGFDVSEDKDGKVIFRRK
ncbi:MAG: hypothetical protein QM730_24820 [Anaerolineales bacterium]